MIRALLYARYSTAMQSAASVEDQLRLLRQRAARENWEVSDEFADRAISGSVRERPGLNDCLAALVALPGAVLLAESLDRISRDQEDLARIFKQVRFHGARIVTLSEGEIGALHIGMGGTMSALFLEQLADKVRRGQIGRVEAGRVPGGLSYGYRKVLRLGPDGEPERGLREINEAEAAVVRRIFADYAAGIGPVAIARALNAEGVPSPRGGLWRANTIIGSRQRRNGVLHNALYRGTILFNRQTFRKDPDTRKRISRVNGAGEVIEREAPELRVVDEELWQRVQALLAHYGDQPRGRARRPKRLLSGLMRCGCCGGTVTLVIRERWGCSRAKETGVCGNTRTIANRQAERRIFAAIERELLHPEVIAAYLEELAREAQALRREWVSGRGSRQRRLDELAREDERIGKAIAAGVPLESLVARAGEIAEERERLRGELEVIPDLGPVVAHPGNIARYRDQVARLQQVAAGDEELRREARGVLEALVERIDLVPKGEGKRGADLIVHGLLAGLLQPKDRAGSKRKSVTRELVAGAGFELSRTIPVAA